MWQAVVLASTTRTNRALLACSTGHGMADLCLVHSTSLGELTHRRRIISPKALLSFLDVVMLHRNIMFSFPISSVWSLSSKNLSNTSTVNMSAIVLDFCAYTLLETAVPAVITWSLKSSLFVITGPEVANNMQWNVFVIWFKSLPWLCVPYVVELDWLQGLPPTLPSGHWRNCSKEFLFLSLLKSIFPKEQYCKVCKTGHPWTKAVKATLSHYTVWFTEIHFLSSQEKEHDTSQ